MSNSLSFYCTLRRCRRLKAYGIKLPNTVKLDRVTADLKNFYFKNSSNSTNRMRAMRDTKFKCVGQNTKFFMLNLQVHNNHSVLIV